MGRPRSEFHAKLKSIPTITEAYFNPSETCKLTYPCIIYKLTNRGTVHADNSRYLQPFSYTVTIITTDPDSTLPKVLENTFKRYCEFSRSYEADHLHHFVYTIFY